MADPPSIRAEALSSRAASVPDSSPPACPRLTSPSVGTYAGRVRTHARFRRRQPRLRMLLRRLLHRPIQLPDLLVQYPEQSQQVCPPAVRPRLNVNSRSILCPPGSTAWPFRCISCSKTEAAVRSSPGCVSPPACGDAKLCRRKTNCRKSRCSRPDSQKRGNRPSTTTLPYGAGCAQSPVRALGGKEEKAPPLPNVRLNQSPVLGTA